MRVKARSKKPLFMIAAFALVVALSIGLTSAFLTAKTGGLTNTFTPGSVTCQVVEDFEDNAKSSITVKNTGNVPAYIRVAVVANTVDDEGNITGADDVSAHLAGTGWSENGGYYYYTGIVEPNYSTGELLNSSINLSGKQVTVLAQAIQADGVTKVNDEEIPVVETVWPVKVTASGLVAAN